MSENESFELIALCEHILDDNEVTEEEIKSIGAWLDAHEDMRGAWPSTVLAKPVQDVLLDQSINKTELHQISRLLRRVQKEWVVRRDERLEQAAAEKAMAAAEIMDLSKALLPTIPVTLRVKSHSDRRVVYEVDLSGPSCNCPDWVGVRNRFPIGYITRCCKYVLDAYNRLRPPNGWPGWLDAFLEHGWKPHPAKKWLVYPMGQHPALLSFGGNDWADVYAVADSVYQRFGFNTVERRWSYGLEPKGARLIEKELLKQV